MQWSFPTYKESFPTMNRIVGEETKGKMKLERREA